MEILVIALIIVAVGVILWAVNKFLPLPAQFKLILNIVAIGGLVYWLLDTFGVLAMVDKVKGRASIVADATARDYPDWPASLGGDYLRPNGGQHQADISDRDGNWHAYLYYPVNIGDASARVPEGRELMDVINMLVTNSKFWTVLLLLIQGLLFYFVPAFPKEIWALIDLFVGTIISIILGKQIIAERKALKQAQELQADGEGL